MAFGFTRTMTHQQKVELLAERLTALDGSKRWNTPMRMGSETARREYKALMPEHGDYNWRMVFNDAWKLQIQMRRSARRVEAAGQFAAILERPPRRPSI